MEKTKYKKYIKKQIKELKASEEWDLAAYYEDQLEAELAIEKEKAERLMEESKRWDKIPAKERQRFIANMPRNIEILRIFVDSLEQEISARAKPGYPEKDSIYDKEKDDATRGKHD